MIQKPNTFLQLSASEKAIVAEIANLDACAPNKWDASHILTVGSRRCGNGERWIYVHFVDGGSRPLHSEEWFRLMDMVRRREQD